MRLTNPQASSPKDWRPEDLRAAEKAISTMTFDTSKHAAVAAPTFRRILVGVDGTGSSSIALQWAKEIAVASGAKVWVATVLGPSAKGPFAKNPSRSALAAREAEIGQEVLEKAAKELEKAGLDVTAVLLRGFPVLEILRTAHGKHVDLIIVGSHGHSGRDRVLLGGIADALKNEASCSVLIAKGPFGPGPVLMPVDGSDESRAAAVVGLRLARPWGAEPQVYHVFEPPVFYDPEDARDQFKDILDQIQLPPQSQGIRYLLDLGHPRKRIIEYAAQHQPRLIVMGARGISKLRKLLTGSTTNHVVNEANCSVLLVRRGRS